MLRINNQKFIRLPGSEIIGITNAAPNHPAARFTNNSESTPGQRESNFICYQFIKEKGDRQVKIKSPSNSLNGLTKIRFLNTVYTVHHESTCKSTSLS